MDQYLMDLLSSILVIIGCAAIPIIIGLVLALRTIEKLKREKERVYHTLLSAQSENSLLLEEGTKTSRSFMELHELQLRLLRTTKITNEQKMKMMLDTILYMKTQDAYKLVPLAPAWHRHVLKQGKANLNRLMTQQGKEIAKRPKQVTDSTGLTKLVS